MNFVAESEKEFLEMTWQAIEHKIGAGFVLGLVGDLGAGKTTLVKYIAKKLGVMQEVSSPTFIMHRSYPLKKGKIKTVEHIDLYRFNQLSKRETKEALEWMADQGGLTIVEWADLMQNGNIYNCIINIKILDKNRREVTIKWN